MKINKNFTLDIDLVEKLNKIDNSSRLVNDLLSDYFSIMSEKNTIFEQKQAILKQNKAKMKEIKRDLKLFKFLETQKFDQRCINYVCNKEFKYSDDEIDTYITNRKIKISFENFRKCGEIIKDNGNLFKHY
jgi:hypothetical protein